MNKLDEQQFWNQAGVSSVSDFADFPLPSHADLVQGIKRGSVDIGIDLTAAMALARYTKSMTASVFGNLIGFIPIMLSLLSVLASYQYNNWLMLTGIPAALLAYLLVNPRNPLHKVFYVMALTALAYCIIAGGVGTTSTWLANAYGTSLLALRFWYRLSSRWAYAAVLGSEAFTAYLWKTSSMHIEGKEFGLKSHKS